ncbi:MAG: exo-alpha-sialidase, partial [Spiribacter salinus]
MNCTETFLEGVLKDAHAPALWGGGPLPNSADVPMLENVEFSLIKPHQPEIDGGNWILGVALAWHNHKLYASYGFNANPEENTATEQARGQISTDDGKTWGQEFTIDCGEGSLGVSHGVFHSHQGKLWAFQGAFYDNFQRTHTRAYLLNDATGEWVLKGVVLDNGFWPMQRPLKMADGNWIMSGVRIAHGLPAENHYPAVAISRGDDFTDWEMVLIPAEAELGRVWGESTVVVKGATILNVARYGGKPEKNRALVAISDDFGRTWTPSRQSNLTMTTSKPFTGTLSTGETYLIGTTTADCGARRTPLTIALSRPGETQLRHVFAIRHAVFPDGPGPSGPEARLSYPYAIEHDGKLYVGYADKHHHTAELAI